MRIHHNNGYKNDGGRRWLGFGLLAAAMTTAGCSVFSVPSGPGLPMGPSFRNATHVLTLVATDEPHAPALQPNQVPSIPLKVGLLLTPLDGSPAPGIIQIARSVSPSSDPNAIRLLGLSGDQVWIRAGKTYVYDLLKEQLTEESNPPPFETDRRFASMVTTGWRPSETRWIGLHTPDDVATGKLQPGSPVMPGIFPLRSTPYEPGPIDVIPTRERRRLYVGQIDASGPIPRFLSMDPLGEEEYSNGVVLTDSTGPDGALIAYEGRFPDLTLHVRRINADGDVLWTTDTRITRDPQILPDADLLVLRGVPQVPSGEFPQPILVLLDTRTGTISTSELRW